MDRSAIKTLIQAAGYGTDTQSTTAQDQAITAALLEIAAEREWSWLLKRATVAVSAGASTVTYSGFSPVLEVPKRVGLSTASGYWYLQEVPAEDIRRRLDADVPATTGVPTEWAWDGDEILFWPKADAAYTATVDYVAVPLLTSFDDNAEAPPFSLRFHTLLAWGAIRWLAFRQRDVAGYNTASTEFTRAKQQLEQADRRGEPGYVTEWPGWNALVDG